MDNKLDTLYARVNSLGDTDQSTENLNLGDFLIVFKAAQQALNAVNTSTPEGEIEAAVLSELVANL